MLTATVCAALATTLATAFTAIGAGRLGEKLEAFLGTSAKEGERTQAKLFLCLGVKGIAWFFLICLFKIKLGIQIISL